MKTKLNIVEIRFFNRHPSGVRPGWMPRWVRARHANPFEIGYFFAVNWRDKELVIEWSSIRERES